MESLKIDEEKTESIDSKDVEEDEIEPIDSKILGEENELKLENSKTQSYTSNNKLVIGSISIIFIIIAWFVLKNKKK